MSWNGTDPYDPNIDPDQLQRSARLQLPRGRSDDRLGMPGVSTWNFGDGFAHPVPRFVAMNHNAIGRGYETFGNGTAETLTQSLSPDDTSPVVPRYRRHRPRNSPGRRATM
jgi:hypothetical protein